MWKDFLLEKLGYTVVFIVMLLLFALYPLWIEEMLYNNLISLNIPIKTTVRYEIMRYVPMVYISLIGLLFSWINTYIYCFVGNEKRNIIIASLFYTVLSAWIVGIIISSYYEFLSMSTTDNTNVKNIQHFYSTFSDRVTPLTFATFIFYSIIDISAIWKLKDYKSTNLAKDYKNRKGRIDFKYSLYQFAIIDIPVLGSLLIFLLVTKMDITHFAFDEDDGNAFLNIFSSGAWGMQLIYSQVVFYIITISYYIDLTRIEKDSSQPDTTHG
jgi:hypothetical protein